VRFATLTFLVLALCLAVASACGSHGAAPPTVDASLGPLEAHPPSLLAPAARLDAASTAIVFDTLRGGVWVANGDVGTVSYVDIDSFKVVAEIAVGGDVRSVAESPDKAWIAAADRAGGNVALIDGYTNTVMRTIAVGAHPRAVVWNAVDPRWLYVALEGADAVAIVDRTLGALAQTIPVGRMPSGVAVSRQRNELYVSHRIDAKISIVDLGRGVVVDDVPLAIQPAQTAPTVPNGVPFSFEGISWQPDGNIAWVPHELLAPTHPFQFQTTVFPAISVVDLLHRAEVITDPNSGETNGRKLLFDAINIPDPEGNPSIVSQPCAITQDRNAIAVYALACGSDDLLTFDETQGIAVGLLRNLPGDHPVGITLDDTGQRAFVVSDQSHTLLTYDTSGGSPFAQLRLLNGPLPLVAKDPLPPQLRAGQVLFFSANGLARNAFATTGDNWLSCGACHLDGFGEAEVTLFENAGLQNPATNALIGHVGLQDFFASAATPTAAFEPHDILVALLDQGGLAPDRTGQIRTGQVDPASPPPAAAAMATQLAYVVARDLPIGPSWLSSSGAPNLTNDTSYCGECHAREYAAWQASAHAHAAADPMMRFCGTVEEGLVGQPFTRLCAGCHDPTSARAGDTSLTSGRGVTCLSCHETEAPIGSVGNADLLATPYDWTVDHKARASAGLVALRQPTFCGGCHAQFVPGTGLTGIDTLSVWQHSSFAGPANTFPDGGLPDDKDAEAVIAYDASDDVYSLPVPTTEDGGVPPFDEPTEAGVDAADGAVDSGVTRCIDCHMPVTNGTADHRFIGGNVYLAEALGDGGTVAALTANLAKAVRLSAAASGSGYLVTVRNVGAGHDFPNGVPDIREAWVEMDALDANKNVLLRIGGPDSSGILPPSVARFGEDLAGADGGILLRHELSLVTHIPFSRRVPPGGAVDVFIQGPPSLPAGTKEVDAVLYLHNVRTTFYRAATGDSTGTTPQVEVARAIVP
jgi:DNA-binding beta-propeller fold protein YncE